MEEIPGEVKRMTVEFFIRRKKDVKEIVKLTGIPPSTVYDCIRRFQQTGTCASRLKHDRPATVVTKAMVRRVYLMLYRNIIGQFRRRLETLVEAEGWNFEHLL